MITTLDHVGLLVPDPEPVVRACVTELALAARSPEHEPELGIRIDWIDEGATALEVISPAAPGGRAAHRLAAGHHGVDHVAFGVPDVALALDELAAGGVPLADARPRRGAHGRRIAFLDPAGVGGLRVELVEVPEDRAAASGPAGRPLDHVGLVTDDLEAIERVCALLGAPAATEQERGTAMEVLWIDACGLAIQCIRPTRDDTRAAAVLRSAGPGLHHLGFAVPDVDRALEDARDRGLRTADRVGRPGARGRSVGFLDARDTGGVPIELVSSITPSLEY